MALFTDGAISTIEDLNAQDSQLLTVASVEGIDVTQKLGSAQDELGIELVALLARSQQVAGSFWGSPALKLNNIAITPPLKLWHIYRALELVYSDAYNSQLNDRYGAKRDQFHQMAGWASEKLAEIGVGVILNPVPQADSPAVSAIEGNLQDGTYYVTMTWVNAEGEEGASAIPAVITVTESTFAVQPVSPPQGTTGWNVYAGSAPENMMLQNASPIGPGQSWQQLMPLATTGQQPSSGQHPTYVKPIPRLIQRG
jgi:hypothetical protein